MLQPAEPPMGQPRGTGRQQEERQGDDPVRHLQNDLSCRDRIGRDHFHPILVVTGNGFRVQRRSSFVEN